VPVPPEPSAPRRVDAALPPARSRWRALAAPFVVAAFSVAAALGAALALAPAAIARGPVGRRPAPDPTGVAEEHKALEA
jgi:hypothetical protein